jgi:hypothetical protein
MISKREREKILDLVRGWVKKVVKGKSSYRIIGLVVLSRKSVFMCSVPGFLE